MTREPRYSESDIWSRLGRRYEPAAQTDIRRTFKRAQEQKRTGDPLIPETWEKRNETL